MNQVPAKLRVCLRLAFWFTVFVILAGSVVRTTGSGLGCPDWPKCFGQWVPPTHLSELPADYKNLFKVAGKDIADFSAFKTWIEYLNRLAGVFLGIILIFLAGFAVNYRSSISKKIFWGSLAALFLVIVQGGLGALVVATHLHGQTITLHMALALLLSVLLFRLYSSTQHHPTFEVSGSFLRWSRVVYALTLVQLVLGTEVRKTIDHLVHDFVDIPRLEWGEHLNWIFLVHRSASILFLIAVVLWYRARPQEGAQYLDKEFKKLGVYTAAILVTGVVLRELGFPAWAQPAHLVLATLLLVQVDSMYRFIRLNSMR